MKIINTRKVSEFCKLHADCRKQFYIWIKMMENRTFSNANELQSTSVKSSILKNNRMAFRIKGYRLIVECDFNRQMCMIKWVGTHDTYDRINANTI
jgi:mRNA interferase HigB